MHTLRTLTADTQNPTTTTTTTTLCLKNIHDVFDCNLKTNY